MKPMEMILREAVSVEADLKSSREINFILNTDHGFRPQVFGSVHMNSILDASTIQSICFLGGV